MATISFLIVDGTIADDELMVMLDVFQHLIDVSIVVGESCLFNFLSMKFDVDVGRRVDFLHHNLHDRWTVEDDSAVGLLEAEFLFLEQGIVPCSRCEDIFDIFHHHG